MLTLSKIQHFAKLPELTAADTDFPDVLVSVCSQTKTASVKYGYMSSWFKRVHQFPVASRGAVKH